jgi:cytochrome c peroxidase
MFSRKCSVLSLFVLGHPSIMPAQESPPADPQLVELGKLIFFDQDLAVNGTQPCHPN